MRKFEDVTHQIEDAALEYYAQGLETFFLPPKDGKTLEDLIQKKTAFDVVKRVSSYGYGSMVELEVIKYRRRHSTDVVAKYRITVNYDISDGVLHNINVRYGF